MNWRLHDFCAVVTDIVSPQARILDFGCGTGQLAQHLQERHFVLSACDIAEQMIATARRLFGKSGINWITLPAGWERLPLAAHTFDAVVSSSVLEYVGELDNVFGEFARVLRDGGVLIFNVPNPDNARRKREQWFSQMTRPPWIRRVVSTVPRIGRFLTYLELSKNRFPVCAWETVAARHGFRMLPQANPRTAKRALFLLVFQKRTGPGGDAQ